MKKVVIDAGDFEITQRELLFSIIIIFVMMATGFFISEKISTHVNEKNQIYQQSVKIDENQQVFEYAMRTNAGNAFVFGTLLALDPVTIPEIEGEYAYIEISLQRYTQHQRIETRRVNGHTQTYIKYYWTWDTIDTEKKSCTKISFLNHEFDYGTIPFPNLRYVDTVYESSRYRRVYNVYDTKYQGSIFAKLADNTVTNVQFINDMASEEAMEYLCKSATGYVIIFWLIWFILMIIIVGVFYVAENNWIED